MPMSIERVPSLAAAVCAAVIFGAPIAAQTDPELERWTRNGVFVIGSLHGLHETEQGFGFDVLKRILEKAAPHVIVVEARPDELTNRSATPGRPEYPRVVWPLLSEQQIEAIPMEPGGTLFTELTSGVKDIASEHARRDSSGVAFWSRYQTAFAKTLVAHWSSAADVHDDTTADMCRAFYLVQAATFGDAFKSIQDRWDDFMTMRALEAVRRHPERRIVVLASYRNRHRFVDILRAAVPERVVSMQKWLASAGY
jgi:hypothetical protein